MPPGEEEKRVESGEESSSRLHAAQAVGYCVPEGSTAVLRGCSMQRRQQVAGPVRWAYCAKKKINCVRTHNRAMNQNHTSWLYIDIRLANECPPPLCTFLRWMPPVAYVRYANVKREQTSCGACPDSEVACHPQLEPQIAATINRTMQIEQ